MLANRPRIYNLLHAAHFVKERSQTHPEERSCLCRHLQGRTVAVEIGTFMGLTASTLARALDPNAKLYCIDSYPNGGEPLMQIAERTIRRSGMSARVTLIRSTSLQAIPQLPSEVDFIFVDGDHSEEGLIADWQFVCQLLKPGGIAAFHDVNPCAGMPSSPEAAHFFTSTVLTNPQFTQIDSEMSLAVMQRLV